jgi:hypothetical protein
MPGERTFLIRVLVAEDEAETAKKLDECCALVDAGVCEPRG